MHNGSVLWVLRQNSYQLCLELYFFDAIIFLLRQQGEGSKGSSTVVLSLSQFE